VAIAASMLLVSSGASGDDLPLSYAARPLTLPRLVLEPTAEGEVANDISTRVNLSIGAAFGITDNFQVDILALPLQLSPSVIYGQLDQPGPLLGLTYRFAGGVSEGGLHLDATAITLPESSGAVIRPGLAFRFHAGDIGRIDMGIYVPITVARSTAAGFEAPVAFAVDVAPPFHIGVSSGISFVTFDAPLNLVFPVGLFAGYAIGGKDGPILDIDPFVRFPQALAAAPESSNAATSYQVGAQLRCYLYL
jgi:hypothetical protein